MSINGSGETMRSNVLAFGDRLEVSSSENPNRQREAGP